MGSLSLIAVEIDVTDATAYLHLVEENLGDLREPLTELLTLGLADARADIASQGTLFGDGWAGMSPWTPIVARTLYGKERSPGTLLEDTGALVASLEVGGPANLFEVGPTEGSAGSAALSPRNGFPTAAAMQEGTSRTFHVLQGEGFSETGIPPRPFLSWHEERSDEYVAIFARHILPEE